MTSPTSSTRAGDALALEVRRRRRLDGHSSSADRWSVRTRLSSSGMRAVERAHPRLDVRDRDAGLRGGQPAGERRVRVAVDEHDVGPLVRQQRAERGEHARGLLGVRPACRGRARARAAGRPSSREEHRRQLVVVVLAGVDEQLLVALAQRARHRRRLDELRPVPDDGDDLHPAIAGAPRARCAAAKASCAARVSGPGAAAAPSRRSARRAAPRACVEARNASCAPSSSSSVTGRSTRRGELEHAAAGDRVQDVVVERRRDERRRRPGRRTGCSSAPRARGRAA